MRGQLVHLVALLVAVSCGAVAADTVKGRIKIIAKKASTIQLESGDPPMVRYGPSTEYVNASGIKDLGTKDLIEAEFTPGQPATRITKVVFALDEALQIDTVELERILAGERGEYTLVDARPAGPYLAGHIPTAKSIFGKELEERIDELPAAKDALVVFYCGGPTCPFTGMSIKIARKLGYTNIKGYQIGIPAWKEAGKPVHASADWVAKSLDPHHVILDVRDAGASAQKHLPGAVAMPSAELAAMTKGFIEARKPARLPGVADKRAPIVLYGDRDDGADVLAAYAELKKWKYGGVAILEGGLERWTGPTESGKTAAAIHYVRKPKEGAITPEAFAKIDPARSGVVLLDVRSDKEASSGTVKGATHIPLDDLEAALAKVPREGEVVAYCASGARAAMAYELLKRKGYANVSFLDASVKVDPSGKYSLAD